MGLWRFCRDTAYPRRPRDTLQLAFRFPLLVRFALLADCLTFHDVLLFATPLTLSQNLDASIIDDGFGAINFDVWRGLGHSARMLAAD